MKFAGREVKRGWVAKYGDAQIPWWAGLAFMVTFIAGGFATAVLLDGSMNPFVRTLALLPMGLLLYFWYWSVNGGAKAIKERERLKREAR